MEEDNNVVNNLRNVVEEIDKWKFSTFNQVKRQKKEAMRRLEGIQKKLQQHDNIGGMRSLEHKVKKELSRILNQEELIWYQRSRTKWLVDGDRNIKFYHMQTIARRKRNRIIMLKDQNGEWISDQEDLKRHVTTFYMKLFC